MIAGVVCLDAQQCWCATGYTGSVQGVVGLCSDLISFNRVMITQCYVSLDQVFSLSVSTALQAQFALRVSPCIAFRIQAGILLPSLHAGHMSSVTCSSGQPSIRCWAAPSWFEMTHAKHTHGQHRPACTLTCTQLLARWPLVCTIYELVASRGCCMLGQTAMHISRVMAS
jgi:hypothetical protein